MAEQKQTHPLREYGYGSSDQYVNGVPRVLGPIAAGELPPCPGCGCTSLFSIEVNVTHPLLAGGGIGVGRYVGCPACPFASPMVMAALGTGPKAEEKPDHV